MKTLFGSIPLGLALLAGVISLNAQNTNVTYQGRVRSGGSDFNGTGQFKFALVTTVDASAPATATAVPSGGFVTIINVISGGSGYVTAPAVTISGGGGSGATATASVSGGAVTSVTVNNPGSGYGISPTVSIAAPPENLSYATYWSNDGTSSAGSEPTAAVIVPVDNGLFTVQLGDGALANMTPLGAGLFGQPDLQLRIWFNDGANGFAVLHPAQRLTATPYALVATGASNLLGVLPASQLSGQLTGAQIADGAVNAAKVDSSQVQLRITGTAPAGLFLTGITADGSVSVGADTSDWKLGGNSGTTAGTHFLGTTDTNALEFKVNGQRALRIESVTDSPYGYSPSILGGFSGNIISNGFVGTVIGGGGSSLYPNRAGGDFATVVGGRDNTASGFASTAMGLSTTASGERSTAMGYNTTASDLASTAMGYGTTASGRFSTAIGHSTLASGMYSTAMGASTTASGMYSTAMGIRAKANHEGAFVWADTQSVDFASTGSRQFCIRASGGVQLSGDTRIFFGAALNQRINLYGTAFGIGIQNSVQYSRVGVGGGFGWYAGGVHNDNTYNAGGGATLMKLDGSGLTVNGAFVSGSDRNAKENFAPVQSRAVLEKVLALPLSSWNYKADAATRHVGPMAQDFYAAFNVGPDDKHIATVDADGVALAAIQGLNHKLEEELKRRDAENAELKQTVNELKELVQTISQQFNGGGR